MSVLGWPDSFCSINYFHFRLTDQGFGPLAMLLKQTAIQEMGHVELLAERILFLKGDVEIIPAGPIEKIVEPESILVKAMAMEDGSARDYNAAALKCEATRIPRPNSFSSNR